MSQALLATISTENEMLDPGLSLLYQYGLHTAPCCVEATHHEMPIPRKQNLSLFDETLIPPTFETCIHDAFRSQCTRSPHAEALVSDSQALSYHQLDVLSSVLARHLQKKGVNSCDNVGFCFEKNIWAVVSMMGILKAGGCCVPLDPAHPIARIETIIQSASISTVLVENSVESLHPCRAIRQVAVNQKVLSQLSAEDSLESLNSYNPKRPSDPAFLLFTSGSTGTPKAVVLTHSAICSSAKYHGKQMSIGLGSRVYQHAAYTFDMSIYDIFTTLNLGGTICIPSGHDRLQRIAESIQTLGANWAFFTPTLLSTLRPEEVPTLQTILLAGERVTQDLIDTWAHKVQLLNGYGATEMSTCFLKRLSGTSDTASIGKPQGVIAFVVDPEDCTKPLLSGPGELVVIGPVLASGYLNDSERTNASFLSEHQQVRSFNQKYRAYKTGDIVERIHDGSYRFLGRKDTMVKIRGLRVELGEIEHHLSNHPSIAHCIVIYPRRGVSNEKLTAVVHPAASNSDDAFPLSEAILPSSLERMLIAHLESLLPSYMIPRSWIFVRRFEMTSSGKIDRRAVTSFVESGEGSLAIIKSEHPTQPPDREKASLGGCATPSLQPSIFQADQLSEISFLDLGLDSINLIGLSKILKKAYNIKIDVATLGTLSLHKLLSYVQPCEEANPIFPTDVGSTPQSMAENFKRLVQKIHIPTEVGTIRGFDALDPSQERSLNVLLTGATGFVGPRILNYLLNFLPEGSKVISLVRASNVEHGLQRISDSLKGAGLALSQGQMDRLEIWPGDLSRPNFALTTSQLARLLAKNPRSDSNIDIVVHNGALVNWTLAYESLEVANVHSTISLINHLMARPFPGMMVYVSGGRVLEIATDPGLYPDDNIIRMLDAVERSNLSLVGYDVSKLLSESLVRAAGQRSTSNPLKTHVVRPGYIIGDAHTGHVNPDDYIWRVVATAIRLRKRCQEPETSWIYLAGVDDVAKRIVRPLLDSHGPSNVLNFEDNWSPNITQGVTIRDFWNTVSSVFQITLEIVDTEQWLSAVEDSLASSKEAEQHPLYPVFEAHKADHGIMGPERESEYKRGSDEEVLKCLEMSLRFLRENSIEFRDKLGDAE